MARIHTHILLWSLVFAGCGGSPTSLVTVDMAVAPVTDLRPAGCVGDGSCSGVTPHCDVKTGRCVACLADEQCPSGELCNGGVCGPGCTLGHGCGDGGGVCDLDAGVCHACGSDGDCKDPGLPRCDLPSKSCVVCLPQNDNCPLGEVCVARNGSFACGMGCKTKLDCAGDGGVRDCCNSVCTDLSTDNGNCGVCGKTCNGQSCCGSVCFDLTSDAQNCGACGNVCMEKNASSTCSASQCAVGACGSGFADCDKNPNNGCEISTSSDVANCGACGAVCAMVANATPTCAAGACVANCAMNFADCDQKYGDGCEVNLTADAMNCGKCGMACAMVANGTAGCAAGLCGVGVCNQHFADCDMNAMNGCEVDTSMDVKNCGACGTACAAVANGTAACLASMCGVGMCNPGFADCDLKPLDGCEVNTLGDVANCGKCGTVCPPVANGSAACTAGQCGIGMCTAPFLDCDMNAIDGCEVNGGSDVKNCGGCGQACAMGQACCGGACSLLSVDSNNCGKCGHACPGNNVCINSACIAVPFPSTGADGDFNPKASLILAAGVYNFQRITIKQGVTVSTNGIGVLDLRATSDVSVAGVIDVSGAGGGAVANGINGGGAGGPTGMVTAPGINGVQANGAGAKSVGGPGGQGSPGANGGGGLYGLGGANGGGGGGSADSGQDYNSGAGGGGGGFAGGAGGFAGADGCVGSGGAGGGPDGAEATACSARAGGGKGGGAPYDGQIGGIGSSQCTLIAGSGGGGSIGTKAAGDLAMTTTFQVGSGGGGGGNGGEGNGEAASGGGGGGGGGGGALRISSATSIHITGLLVANGGAGGTGSVAPDDCNDDSSGGGGGGSGGAIWLSAPTVSTANGATVSAVGGKGGFDGGTTVVSKGGDGGLGRILLSAINLTDAGAFNPPLPQGGNKAGFTFLSTWPN